MTPAHLRITRIKLGLTQAQLADKLGVTARAVRRWEAGERRIPKYVDIMLKETGK